MKQCNIDDKFDKADKVVDRLGKLIIKIVGGIIAIGVALFLGLNQLDDAIGDVEDDGKHQQEEMVADIPESAPEHQTEYTITKQTFLVDDYGERSGDTVYVDYYDDGYIDMYYKSDHETYYEGE